MSLSSIVAEIQTKRDGRLVFSIPIPDAAALLRQRIVIPIEFTYNARPLGQFREAVFILKNL